MNPKALTEMNYLQLNDKWMIWVEYQNMKKPNYLCTYLWAHSEFVG